MFEKLLFATTASPTCDNAAKVAFDLEMKWEAKLFVFHVLGVPTRGYSPFVTDIRTGETEQALDCHSFHRFEAPFPTGVCLIFSRR